MRPDIQAADGRYINFLRPDLCHWDVQSIAHSLSHICRFTGHCKTFYSVAEHAYRASFLVPPHLALRTLHHDDEECAVGDMSSPLKALLPEYKAIAHRVRAAIFKALNLGDPKLEPEVKVADLVMLATEKRDLMPSVPEGATIVVRDPESGEDCLVIASADSPWRILDGVAPLSAPIYPMPPHTARHLWMRRHCELMGVPFHGHAPETLGASPRVQYAVATS
jgi:hypothetical protein